MVPCCFFVAMLAPLVLALEQSPDMVIKEGQSVKVECSKKKSTSSAMYWYMLPSGKNSSLTLLASAIQGSNAAVEKEFENHFKSSNIKGDSITLSIDHAFLNHSGTYFCAENEHSECCHKETRRVSVLPWHGEGQSVAAYPVGNPFLFRNLSEVQPLKGQSQCRATTSLFSP
ncbi:uncharacterized protein ACIQIH_002568 [Cyanocitta cristata]